MLHRMKFFLLAVLMLAAVGLFTGCNRLTGDENLNEKPVVAFVNVPLDSSVFSFAPVVRWIGYDPDGIIQAYQYHDDSTQAAVNAYAAGDGPLADYIAGLPPSAWTTTYATSDTIYLRRSETDSITQHVFMVRAIDNHNEVSPVKVRTYFRTNRPPNGPQIKWAFDPDRPDGAKGYLLNYTIPDTLLWGDTLTSTWSGINFLWRGSDPDSRELNVIPLTFSYKLVNNHTGLSFPHPVYDDSNRVARYDTGWCPWTSNSQVTYTASHARQYYADYPLDGSYTFYVRVRDDGLTESDTVATATFTALAPTFHRQLLIVDWTAHPATVPNPFGMVSDDSIRRFYDENLPGAFAAAEQARQMLYYFDVPEPIVFDDEQVQWFLDKNLATENRVPFDYIRQFKWVWIISDNPDINPPEQARIAYRLDLFSDYLDVGGQLMISGRRIFKGAFNLGTDCGGTLSAAGSAPEQFLRNYFHLSAVCPAFRYQASSPKPDFFAANPANPDMPYLEIDTAKVHALTFTANPPHPQFLPEIDYFGLSGGTTGFDYAATLSNYVSSTSLDTSGYNVFGEDCAVRPGTTASQVYLSPLEGRGRILSVSRIYNRTKDVYADFIDVDREPPSGNLPGPWRIIASTPASAGIWLQTDVLEVDYRYIPIRQSNDQPVATNYIKFQGGVTYDPLTGEFGFHAEARFRTALYTIPFYFMRNEPVFAPLMGTELPPVQWAIAYQILFFNGAGSNFERLE